MDEQPVENVEQAPAPDVAIPEAVIEKVAEPALGWGLGPLRGQQVDFALVCFGVFGVMLVIKNVIKALPYKGSGNASFLDHPASQIGMLLSPSVIGVLLSVTPGIFDELPMVWRAILGLSAGWMAQGIVYKIVKRVAPEAMVSSETSGRKNDKRRKVKSEKTTESAE